jgi:hypothetical protein
VLRGPNSSGSSPPGSAGARPLAFSPIGASPSRTTIANRSPPGAHWYGSVTTSTPAAASAASHAFPPSSSARRPASAASGFDVATMPRRPTASERRCERDQGWAAIPGGCQTTDAAPRQSLRLSTPVSQPTDSMDPGGAGGSDELRPVTALFADIVGSTGLGERMSPDEVKAPAASA